MTLEKKRVDCVLLGAALDGNVVKGAAAVTGNLDRGNDVIFPGAFKSCTQQFLTSGFVAANHDWTWEGMKAMPTLAEERGNQLYTEATFHSTPDAQDIRTKCMERIENGLSVGQSIGFGIDPESTKTFRNGADLLAYAAQSGADLSLFDVEGITGCKSRCRAIIDIPELYEYSIVAVPMNPLAVADSVKGETNVTPENTKGADEENKGASGSTTLPIADRDTAWDSGEAEKRVRTWAEAEDGPNAKYAKAFFWHAEDASKFGDNKLPFADVIDAKLTAVPRGVFAGAGAINGARGGVDIPEGDLAGVKSRMEKYYARFREKFNDDSIKAPWAEDGKSLPDGETVTKGEYLGDYVEASATIGVLDTLQCAVFYAVADVLYDCDMDGDTPGEMMETITAIFAEFVEIALRIIGAILTVAGDDGGAKAAAEEIRALWPSPEEVKNALPAGARLAKHSAALLAGARELKERIGSLKDLRLKEGRRISGETMERLAGNRDSLQTVVDDLSDLLTSAGGNEPDGTALMALKAKAMGHRADLNVLAMR